MRRIDPATGAILLGGRRWMPVLAPAAIGWLASHAVRVAGWGQTGEIAEMVLFALMFASIAMSVLMLFIGPRRDVAVDPKGRRILVAHRGIPREDHLALGFDAIARVSVALDGVTRNRRLLWIEMKTGSRICLGYVPAHYANRALEGEIRAMLAREPAASPS